MEEKIEEEKEIEEEDEKEIEEKKEKEKRYGRECIVYENELFGYKSSYSPPPQCCLAL